MGKSALVLGKRQSQPKKPSELVGEIMPVPLLCNTMRFYRPNVLHQGLKIGIFDQFLRQKVNEHNRLILLKSIYCIKRGVYTQKSKRSCEYTDLTAKIKKETKTKKRKKRKKEVKSKGTIGNSWTVLKVIWGHKYHHNH